MWRDHRDPTLGLIMSMKQQRLQPYSQNKHEASYMGVDIEPQNYFKDSGEYHCGKHFATLG